MAMAIENTPSPNILMKSMRSIGYTFKTALADIIDNSISANARNVYINIPINDNEIYISILDDGYGMTDGDLFNAMKYGSDREIYELTDLGRFGLGLKSASLSQCRKLTVASKCEGKISAYQWDLDYVIKNKKWDCLKLNVQDIKNIPDIGKLEKLNSGTIVVWEDLDVAYKKSDGRIREYYSDEMDYAEKHLRLVFHRFLNNKHKQLNIYVNNDPLIGLDPFLEEHKKTDSRNTSEMNVKGSIIKVQTYILPHQSDLSNQDIDKLGGIEELRTGQGFYIYRNNRLIIYGTWFRLSTQNISTELLKYGRIKVDIPNTLDEMWEIDIKKQNATIPKQILNNLKKAVNNVCNRSKDKIEKRVKLTIEKDDTKIWNKSLSSNQKEIYYINSNSNFVSNFIDDFGDKERKKIINFLEILSSSIPYDDIYNSICNKKNETILEDSQIEAIVMEGLSQFKRMKKILKLNDAKTFDIFIKNEPFNDPKVYTIIRERLINEK